MPRLYFLCPDFPHPSGGTRSIYWYVYSLREAGFDAHVVHQQSGFHLTWHGIEVPTLSLADSVDLRATDIVIFPESAANLMRQMADKPSIKVVLALQWSPDYYSDLKPYEHWGSFGIEAIFTPSREIARFLEWRMSGLPITVIPSYIDSSIYRSEPSLKQPLVTYMSRKTNETEVLRAALQREDALRSQFSWQALGDLNEADYARYLQRSLVYLTPSAQEGLNVSVLEAMACGCLVVGYSGIGANEYVIANGDKQNYVAVENGNLPEFGIVLRSVLIELAEAPERYDWIVQNAIATAARYQNRDRELEALTDFFKALTVDPAQPLQADQRSQQPLGFKPSSTQNSRVCPSVKLPNPSAVTSLAQKASQLKQAGQLTEALGTYRQALAHDDSLPELWFNTGNLLQALQQRDDAEAAYRQAIAIRADFYQGHLNLANSLRDRGNPEAAIGHYRTVIELKPLCTLAYRNLGQMLVGQKRYPEAIAVFEAWSDVEPDNPGPINGIGIALQAEGRLEEALSAFRQAYVVDPNRFDSLNNLGTLLRMMRRPHDAIPYLEKAVERDPANGTAVSNLGHALLNLGRTSEAIARVESLLEHNPDSATGQLMRGYALVLQARAKEATDCFERCWHLDNSATSAITNAMFGLLYRDDISADLLTDRLRSWATRFPSSPVRLSHSKQDRDPNRRLKIGYLSADLRSHPVAFFLEPILTHHHPDRVEVTCYHVAAGEDDTSDRLRQYVSKWRRCFGLSDEQLARQIQADNIDILVDLSGHTQGNRAPVLNYKPAPIQMLYIGYPSTTGMEAVDYIIADAAVAPPECETLYTENVLRVDGSFWCFRPHDFAPDPGPLPAIANGHITFGSFNNSAKLSPSTLKLWAGVMAAVPEAKLLLKALAFADEATQTYFRRQLVDFGVAPDRLIFEGPNLNIKEFFEAYQRIDIGLDPTPYNGGTTTCEALWMGVPVVTLRGERFCSRMSHSFLNNVGLSELSADCSGDYVAAAATLASDLDRLQHIRESLRDRMAASPICDGPRAARELEDAFRQAWQAECKAVRQTSLT